MSWMKFLKEESHKNTRTYLKNILLVTFFFSYRTTCRRENLPATFPATAREVYYAKLHSSRLNHFNSSVRHSNIIQDLFNITLFFLLYVTKELDGVIQLYCYIF